MSNRVITPQKIYWKLILRIPKNSILDNEQRLMNVFSWLIREDKKQNPKIYKSNKIKI